MITKTDTKIHYINIQKTFAFIWNFFHMTPAEKTMIPDETKNIWSNLKSQITYVT